MFDFENDPLREVYADLANGKTQTHFDQVLLLKGNAKTAFKDAAENSYHNKITKPAGGKRDQSLSKTSSNLMTI